MDLVPERAQFLRDHLRVVHLRESFPVRRIETPSPPVPRDNHGMADANRMVFLGFGKYARADKIYALEPLGDGERGHGRRTRVWIEGVPDPIIASRTERTILLEMGEGEAGADAQGVDQAGGFAQP